MKKILSLLLIAEFLYPYSRVYVRSLPNPRDGYSSDILPPMLFILILYALIVISKVIYKVFCSKELKQISTYRYFLVLFLATFIGWVLNIYIDNTSTWLALLYAFGGFAILVYAGFAYFLMPMGLNKAFVVMSILLLMLIWNAIYFSSSQAVIFAAPLIILLLAVTLSCTKQKE